MTFIHSLPGRLFTRLLAAITPARWRGRMLVAIGALGSCGRSTLFCTLKIGTEPYLIHIGDGTIIASDVMFVTHDMSPGKAAPRPEYAHAEKYGEIHIGSDCFIGAAAIILPRVRIGNRVIIGAGSIVRKDVLAPGVYAGSGPAFICSLDDYFARYLKTAQLHHEDLASRYANRLAMNGVSLVKR